MEGRFGAEAASMQQLVFSLSSPEIVQELCPLQPWL